MKRTDSLSVLLDPGPSKPAYPSLLDLALRQGRRVVLVGGTVAALSGGAAGCDAAKDAVRGPELAGADVGGEPDVPGDEGVAFPYDLPGGTDMGSLPDVPLEVPDTFIVPDPGGVMDLGALPETVEDPGTPDPDAVVQDAPLPGDAVEPIDANDPDAAPVPESSP